MRLPRTPHWWPRWLGKRAVGMIGCAWIWIWLGIGNFQDVQTTRPDVVYLEWPPQVRAAMWIIPAVIAAATAPSRRVSYVGLGLLTVPILAVFASYAFSMVVYLLPGGGQGYQYAYFSAALYGAMLGMITYVAYQPSAEKVTP